MNIQFPEPYDFQKIAIWEGKKRFNGRVFIGDDVGLGKTLEGLHIARYFRQVGRPIVVCCPNAVKYQWEIETHKHTGWGCWILNGLKAPGRMPSHIPPVIIINWEILRGSWTDRLIGLEPCVIIGDEAHNIKTEDAQRTVQFRRLCQGVPHVILLSGTPIENNPMEFFTALNILRPKKFPSPTRFAFRYTNPEQTKWGLRFVGSRNEAELNQKLLKYCYIRRTKEEVLKDLPPLQRTIVPVDIDENEYEAAEKDFLSWLMKTKKGKGLRAKKAVGLTKITHLLGLVATLKLPAIIQWIKEFQQDTGKKLVVFGHHRAFLEALHESFEDQSVLVYGGVSIKKRQALIRKFVTDKKCRIFFGSITATGTGINDLQTVCSNVVVAELIWNGKKIEQSEGRLHRIGQKHPVNAYYLLARKTVEVKMCKAIHEKDQMIQAIVDGKSGAGSFDLLKKLFSDKLKRKRNLFRDVA